MRRELRGGGVVGGGRGLSRRRPLERECVVGRFLGEFWITEGRAGGKVYVGRRVGVSGLGKNGTNLLEPGCQVRICACQFCEVGKLLCNLVSTVSAEEYLSTL